MSPKSPRPLSPWAERFGHGREGREAVLDDIIDHSGFAPKQPRLHPKYYADEPPADDSVRTTLELDHLFTSEAFQKSYFKGSYSWMVGPLMRYVYFSERTGVMSGGHRADDYGPVDPRDIPNVANLMSSLNPPDPVTPASLLAQGLIPNQRENVSLSVFHSERIQVDESKWFPFLRKDRWLDWDNTESTPGGGDWSVDNPRVWEIVSISVELLDRVFKALVADKHLLLETLLYGVNCSWEDTHPASSPPPYKGANVFYSLPYLQRICARKNEECPLDFVRHTTFEDDTTRLERLLQDQTWSFVEKYNNDEGVWGVTTGGDPCIIVIDTGPIKMLMNSDITLSERCLLQYSLMATMLHELFHSLVYHRRTERHWPAHLPPINHMPRSNIVDALLDNIPVAEMGFAAEERILGGRVIFGPRLCDDLPFGAHMTDWPSPWEPSSNAKFIKNHRRFQPGQISETKILSALFVSKLLSAEFWDDASIAQKSANHFHFNCLFESNATFTGHGDEVDYNEAQLSNSTTIVLQTGEREMIRDWRERNRAWNERRAGWYDQASREWQLTPWSDFRRRQKILKFGRFFAKKDWMECRSIAQHLVRRVYWGSKRKRLLQDLPPISKSNNWVFHAIGLLMLAALPIRNFETRSDAVLESTYHYRPRTGTSLLKKRKLFQDRLKEHRALPADKCYDPLVQPGKTFTADQFVQEDYLDTLKHLIEFLASSDVTVSAPWLREIIKTADDLRLQRRNARAGTRFTNTWVKTWDFVIPAYNTTVSKFENGRWTVQT